MHSADGKKAETFRRIPGWVGVGPNRNGRNNLSDLKQLLSYWREYFCPKSAVLSQQKRTRRWPSAKHLSELDRLICDLAHPLRVRELTHEQKISLVDKKWTGLKLRVTLEAMDTRARQLRAKPVPPNHEVRHYVRLLQKARTDQAVKRWLLKARPLIHGGTRTANIMWADFRPLLAESGGEDIRLRDPFMVFPPNSSAECYVKYLEIYCEYLYWSGLMQARDCELQRQRPFLVWQARHKQRDKELVANRKELNREDARERKREERARKKTKRNSVTSETSTPSGT